MTTENQDPKWMIDDGIPGTGDRPEWMPEKFKTVADMAKSYKDLEKNFSQPPENYDLSKSKFLDSNHEAVKDLAQFAKSKRVPAEVMDKFLETTDKYFGEFERDPEKEMAKIGENAKERMDKLNNFVKAHLEEPQYKALMSNINTAESVLALENLRNKFMSESTTIPKGNEGSSTSTPTMAELQAEMTKNLDKYKTDPAYRKDLQARMGLVQNKGFVDKQW